MLHSRNKTLGYWICGLALCLMPACMAQDGPMPDAGPIYQEQNAFVPPIADPFERVNRSIGFLNHGIMMGIINPTSKVYRFIIPKPARKCVNNAGENLKYPVRLVNNLFQGQFSGAWDETQRFGVNTTVGVLGLFDPATKWGFEGSPEDTGLTFRKWGWDSNFYLMMPFFGPGNDRDSLGYFGDMALNPATYLFPASPIFTYNRLSDEIIPYKQLTTSEYDPYAISRDIYTVSRKRMPTLAPLPGDDDSATQTLMAASLRPADEDFILESKGRKVYLQTTDAKLPYSLWLQDQAAPVVYILPGMGGHRISNMNLAIAEQAYNAGFSVVTISSPMNWEFAKYASKAELPGYPSDDALDCLNAIQAIHADLVTRHPARILGKLLLGVSLGGFHTLYIADAAAQGWTNGFVFDRYVAVNPAIDIIHSLRMLDEYYNAPVAWPESEREERKDMAIIKATSFLKASAKKEAPPSFASDEAKYLIGLMYRFNLRDVIHSSQRRNDMGILTANLSLFSRREAYDQIMEISFQDYFRSFMAPYLQRKSGGRIGMPQIQQNCDLKSRAKGLAKNPNVCVLTSRNDFLLTPDDLEWLEAVIPPDNLHILEGGGHLGGLADSPAQNRMTDFLKIRN